jgi:hypothetical protein
MRDHIDILGYTYSVRFRLDPIVYDNDLCEGYCNNQDQRIEVSAELGPDRIRDVFIHEVIHAIYHIFGDRDEWTQERVCDLVGYGIIQVMRRNPDWAQWMLQNR